MEFNKNDYFERIRRYPQQQEILKNSRKQKRYRCIKKMPKKHGYNNIYYKKGKQDPTNDERKWEMGVNS